MFVVVTCPLLSLDAGTLLNTSKNTFGVHVHVTCDEGFKFASGDLESYDVTCLEAGTWSAAFPKCICTLHHLQVLLSDMLTGAFVIVYIILVTSSTASEEEDTSEAEGAHRIGIGFACCIALLLVCLVSADASAYFRSSLLRALRPVKAVRPFDRPSYYRHRYITHKR